MLRNVPHHSTAFPVITQSAQTIVRTAPLTLLDAPLGAQHTPARLHVSHVPRSGNVTLTRGDRAINVLMTTHHAQR